LCLVLLVTSALLSWLFSGKEGFAVYTWCNSRYKQSY
jgi:hypothetical protein